MTTAILMAMSMNQTDVRPSNTDQLKADGSSFAEKLNEQVNGTTEALGEENKGELMSGFPSLSSDPTTRNTDKESAVIPEAKEKSVSTQELFGPIKQGSTANRENAKSTKANAQMSKIWRSSEKPDVVEAPSLSDEERTVGEIFSADQDVMPPESKKQTLSRSVDHDAGLVDPRAAETGVLKDDSAGNLSLNTDPVDKSAKSVQSKTTRSVLGKPSMDPRHLEIESRPSLGKLVDGLHPTIGPANEVAKSQELVANPRLRDDANNVSESASGPVLAEGKSYFVLPIAPNDSVMPRNGADGTMGTRNVEAPSGVDGQVELLKQSAEVEKSSPKSMNTGEARVQTEPGLGAAIPHTISDNAGYGSGIVSPDAAAFGPSVMKLAPDRTTSHPTGLPSELVPQSSSIGMGGSSDEVPRMLTATPTALEVGVQSGVHGWLRVRAEMTDGGVVNASVSATSTMGQQMLHSELPALTAFLQTEKVAVHTIAVHPTAPESRGGGTGMDGGSGGQTQQGGNDEAKRQKDLAETTFDSTNEVVSHESLNGIDDDGASALATYVGGGSWLSVRA